MPLKVLVIGGATFDIIIEHNLTATINLQQHSEKNPLLCEDGSKIEVTNQQYAVGGGAANVSISLKKFGFDVHCFVKIAKDILGKYVLEKLKLYGLDISNITYSKTCTMATSYIIPTVDGDRIVFAHRGSNRNLLTENFPLHLTKDADFIYITSLTEGSFKHLPKLLSFTSKNNVKVVFNPGNIRVKIDQYFMKEIISLVDILILNYEEVKSFSYSYFAYSNRSPFVQKFYDNLTTASCSMRKKILYLKDFFQTLFTFGIRIIVVTDGKHGVFVATRDSIYFHHALSNSNVVNTLGAGDAFGSSFCGALYSGEDICKAIMCGLINSASVIQYHDANTGLLRKEEIVRRYKLFKGEFDIIQW